MQTNFIKMMLLASLALAVVSLNAGSVMAQDGKALYTAKLCPTCHGADAKTPIMPVYPKLAGQNSVYIEQQVKDIRDKKRTNGQAAAMQALVAAVTDAEIKAIATYLGSLK